MPQVKNEKELLTRISELEKQIEILKSRKKYGLVWEEKTEDVVLQCKENVPILREVKSRKIVSGNSTPANLLIEGDNYHSLSVLNYTHKGKIDVIYIDPPYNTGNEDFIYNDNLVDKDDGYRHSKWISFIEKRLKLAKELLSKDGVIFISIDDNEVAQLKLLCDEVFSDTANRGYVGTLIWQRAKGGGNSKKVVKGHEYILCYSKSDELTLTQKGDKSIDHIKQWEQPKNKDKYVLKDNKLFFINDDVIRRVFGKYEKGTERRCEYENLLKFKGEKVKKEIDAKIATGEYILKKVANGKHYICRLEPVTNMRQVMYTILQGFLSEVGKNDLAKIGMETLFDYPKPVGLIKILLDTIAINKDVVILDFFAGSGTTGHAVLELNKQDSGNRKFILCTNNENNICEKVTYERIKRVMKGYKNKEGEKVDGLGGNLSYYKTNLVNTDKLHKISDDSKIKVTYQAGEMIAVREDTLNEVEKNDWWQIFEGNGKNTAIYFKEDKSQIQKLIQRLEKKNTPVVLYIFSWGKNEYRNEYGTGLIRIEDIPEPILEVYKEINRL